MSRKELTRADLVRLRREKEDARRMQRAAQEVTRRVPPVTARTRQANTAPKRRPARNARRRFQIALHMPRSETRALNLPRPRLGWRLFSFILSALLGTALYLAFNLPELRVTQAQVIGNQILTPADINSALNISGQPIFTLTPSDLETRLRLNYPELVSVKVEVSLPNLVSVRIAERQPLIRWEQGGGYTWIADDGVAFYPRGEMADLISVLALSAPSSEEGGGSDPLSPAPFISTDMVRAVRGLAGHVPPGESILYDGNFGFGWNDPRGWRVYFGTSASDVELKVRVYESMVSSLTQRGIRPALINVMYPTAPYYRLTQ